MLALPVQILPISSIHCLAPLSSRTIIGYPVCAGFANNGVQARHLQFPFVTILRMPQRRQRAPSSLGFELTPSRTGPAIQVFRESAFGHGILMRSPLLFTKAAGTRSHKIRGLSLLECALTQKGVGVSADFTLQSTSFFVRSSVNAIMASFGAAVASTRKACGKGRRHGQS